MEKWFVICSLIFSLVEYWNKLPPEIKGSTSVVMFKNRLESYKTRCLSEYCRDASRHKNYWELSDILFDKINDENRESHVKFLIDNPEIAKFKKLTFDNI